jgi:signal transduction histidine kinase/ActR/RegA family two-component response regulator
MSAPERSIGSEPPAAGVHFYEDDDVLCASVAQYLGAGLALGDVVLVIATEPRWQAIDAALGRNAFDVQRAMKAGRLIFREARETLAGLMDGSMPDRRLFREALDTLLADVGPQVRAYGEMVDLLWRDGNLPAALRLEELWNELCEERSLPLLCAYVIGPTGAGGSRPEMADGLSTGGRASPAEQSTRLDVAEARMREIGVLQRRARTLEREIGERRQLEIALREALEDRERLLAEVETDRGRLAESEGRQIVQRKRLELLQSITASFARALKPRDVAAVIVDEGISAVGATRGGIWLLAGDGKSLDLVRSAGYSARTLEHCSRLPFDSLMPIARCYSARTQLWLESRADYVAAHPEGSLGGAEESDGAFLCLPLVVDQRCFGAFSLAFPLARRFTADERVFLVTLSHHAAQALERARLFEDAERVEVSQRFLSEASGVLAGSLDYDATLAAVTRLAVPHLADWASIDMVNPDGTFRRVGVAHVDPAKAALAWELSRRHPPRAHDAAGPGNVVRTGQPEVFENISDELLVHAIRDADVLRIIRSLGLVSALCVPLKIGGRPAGAMTLISAESNRHFGATDLALAEELARRASVAIDNARAYREAKEANRLKDDFLATMSHELRTPLNAILGWSSMLRTRPGVDVKKALETIERNARAQVRLIEEILDISRIMTGKLRIDRRALDLASVVRASIDVVSPSARAKGITLDVSLALEACPFYGDADRLQQVCWNLLSNAVKFTPKGGHVRVCLARKASDVELTVEDSGRGIRADFLPVMFQRFRQADSSTTRTEGGLGIGLAIVGHLVELHGGTVTATSAGEGRGARFTVVLPVCAVSVEERAGASPRFYEAKLLAGLRVLVCEDDVDSRELLQEMLSSEGATVRLAAAAGEALDHLREFQPDVLVSDIGLPLVDGYALMRHIRGLAPAEGGRTPAIALTAYAGAEDARRALSAGYQLHVTKPVDPRDLAARVANLAGRSPRIAEESR